MTNAFSLNPLHYRAETIGLPDGPRHEGEPFQRALSPKAKMEVPSGWVGLPCAKLTDCVSRLKIIAAIEALPPKRNQG